MPCTGSFLPFFSRLSSKIGIPPEFVPNTIAIDLDRFPSNLLLSLQENSPIYSSSIPRAVPTKNLENSPPIQPHKFAGLLVVSRRRIRLLSADSQRGPHQVQLAGAGSCRETEWKPRSRVRVSRAKRFSSGRGVRPPVSYAENRMRNARLMFSREQGKGKAAKCIEVAGCIWLQTSLQNPIHISDYAPPQ
jgi:hypothetical protein